MPLGSLLGLPQALLGCLWSPKTSKNNMFFEVFANAAFWVFEALDGPLWFVLAPSWADLIQNGSQNGAKDNPQKVPPKWSRKCAPKLTKKILGPQNGPQNGPRWWSQGTRKSGRRIPTDSWSQDAPKMAQDVPK